MNDLGSLRLVSNGQYLTEDNRMEMRCQALGILYGTQQHIEVSTNVEIEVNS